jgi:SAM-dependent methyltransferase
MRSRDADRAHWEARHAEGAWRGAPSAWVVERALELPAAWLVVELAAGAGRHARALAEAGRRVVAVDFVERAVRAAHDPPGVCGLAADSWALPFADGSLDALVCVSYLERELFPALLRLLAPGGVIVYETFTLAHAALARGGVPGPRNPAYLLEPGELPRLVAPLELLAAREGRVVDGAGERHVASVVARRRAGGAS